MKAELAARAVAEFREPAEADGKQEQDAPDHVVDVTTAHGDVMEGAEVVMDCPGESAHGGEGEKEGEGGEQDAALRAIGDALLEAFPGGVRWRKRAVAKAQTSTAMPMIQAPVQCTWTEMQAEGQRRSGKGLPLAARKQGDRELGGGGDGLLLVGEALTAEDGTTLGGLEGHGVSLPQPEQVVRVSTFCGWPLPVAGLTGGDGRLALGFAAFAAFRLVLELFIVEEKLFAGGEDEVLSAVDALERLVLEFHGRTLSRPCVGFAFCGVAAETIAAMKPGQSQDRRRGMRPWGKG